MPYDMPTISVVMSVFNCEKYLSESIDSIINQSYRDFEFLITDDSSEDGSLGIIEEYAKYDDRIIVFRNGKRVGLTKALNRMIKASKGDFIARMDADDIALNNRLEIQLKVAQDFQSFQVIFSSSKLIDNDGIFICKSWRPSISLILEWMPYYNFIPHPSVFVRKEALKMVGYYNEEYIKAQDWELWNRMIKMGFKFHYINQPLILYRINITGSRLKTRRSNSYTLARLCILNKNKWRALSYLIDVDYIEFVILILMLLLPHSLLITRIVNKRRRNKDRFLDEIKNY
jgi:glycosyltransferase involved in cell wall biosynthesis